MTTYYFFPSSIRNIDSRVDRRVFGLGISSPFLSREIFATITSCANRCGLTDRHSDTMFYSSLWITAISWRSVVSSISLERAVCKCPIRTWCNDGVNAKKLLPARRVENICHTRLVRRGTLVTWHPWDFEIC